MKVDFSRQIFVNTQISNFMKILPVGAELFQEYGQTDMTKLVVAFCFLRTRLETEQCTQFETSEIAVCWESDRGFWMAHLAELHLPLFNCCAPGCSMHFILIHMLINNLITFTVS
jgi:hypothetical protein